MTDTTGAQRPVMTDEELASHEIPAEGIWEAGRLYDGYDRQTVVAKRGWHAISAWGRDGWDLGSWPLVTVYCREDEEGPNPFLVAENVEGDTTVYAFATESERNAGVDRIAFFHWHYAKESWVAGIESAADMPEHLRGPFRWSRLDAA